MASKLMPEDLQIIEGLSSNGAVFTGADYAQGFEVQNQGQINRAPGESPKTNGGRNLLRTMDSTDQPQYLQHEGTEWGDWQQEAVAYAESLGADQDIIGWIEQYASDEPQYRRAAIAATMAGRGAEFDVGHDFDTMPDPKEFVDELMASSGKNEPPHDFGRDLDEAKRPDWYSWRDKAIRYLSDRHPEAPDRIFKDIEDEVNKQKQGQQPSQDPDDFIESMLAWNYGDVYNASPLDHPDFGRDDLDEARIPVEKWWEIAQKLTTDPYELRVLRSQYLDMRGDPNHDPGDPGKIIDDIRTWSKESDVDFARDDVNEAVDEFEVEDILKLVPATPEEKQEILDAAAQIGDVDPDLSSEQFVKQYLAFMRDAEDTPDKTIYQLPDDFGVDEVRQTLGGGTIADDEVADPEEFKRRAVEFLLKEFEVWADELIPLIDVKRGQANRESPEMYAVSLAQAKAARVQRERDKDWEKRLSEPDWMRESYDGLKDAEGFENQVANGITSGGTEVTDEALNVSGDTLNWYRNPYSHEEAYIQIGDISGWFSIFDNTKKGKEWAGMGYPSPIQWVFNHGDENDAENDFDGRAESVEDAKAQCEREYQKMRGVQQTFGDMREELTPEGRLKFYDYGWGEHKAQVEIIGKEGMNLQLGGDFKIQHNDRSIPQWRWMWLSWDGSNPRVQDTFGKADSYEEAVKACQNFFDTQISPEIALDSARDETDEAVSPEDVKKSSTTWHEQIPGGLAKGKQPGEYDLDKLAQGVEVELEHTSDMHIAIEIAMDHLEEDPAYYEKLKKIEKPKTEAAEETGDNLGYGLPWFEKIAESPFDKGIGKDEDITVIWNGNLDWSKLFELLPTTSAGRNLKHNLGRLKSSFGGLLLDQAEAIVLKDVLFNWLWRFGDRGRTPEVNAAEDVIAQIDAELPIGPLKGESKEVDRMKADVEKMSKTFDPTGMKDVQHRMSKRADKSGMQDVQRRMAKISRKRLGESAWDILNEIIIDPHKFYIVQSANKTPDGPVFAAVVDVSPSTGRPATAYPDWDRYSDLETFLSMLDLGDENYQLGLDAEMLWKQLDHKELGMVIDPTDKRKPVNSTTRWENKGKRDPVEPS
jgi:hypothetical protein